MDTLILEKQGVRGNRIRLLHARHMDAAVVDIELDGERVLCGQRLRPAEADLRPPAGITHVCGRVGLTWHEAAVVEAAIAAHQAIINREPGVRLRRLKDQRAGLVDAIAGWIEERTEESDRAWERGDEMGAYVGAAVVAAREGERIARAELVAFDVAHPEVAAAVAADEREAVERFVARD